MFKVKLNSFEGPLDLLLFFIKRDELDIYDIPISYITNEFLKYLELIKILDLEQAGDFILLASTLMHIKVRMLLPKEINEHGEEIDPRAELVQQLLEYKRYKEMAEEFSYFETEQRKIFYRGNFNLDEKSTFDDTGLLLKNITVFDLARAFQRIMSTLKPEPVHQIKRIPVTIEEQMDFIRKKLEFDREIVFTSLVTGLKMKIQIVYTFIAMLEMVRMQLIGVKESDSFNDFVVYSIEND
ncbi:MAG: segregation and condensation protein A [Ignavibacteriaceae bacterium]|nr:MAG: segregation and condensation protein A [Ignavibacteriaceae bacterium]